MKCPNCNGKGGFEHVVDQDGATQYERCPICTPINAGYGKISFYTYIIVLIEHYFGRYLTLYKKCDVCEGWGEYRYVGRDNSEEWADCRKCGTRGYYNVVWDCVKWKLIRLYCKLLPNRAVMKFIQRTC